MYIFLPFFGRCLQVGVCTWFAQELVVNSNGVGCVKQSGLEIAWVHTGLDEIHQIYLSIPTLAMHIALFRTTFQSNTSENVLNSNERNKTN